MSPPVGVHRSMETTEPGRAVVVSPHRLASLAGIEMLEAGGNAVDAAVAVDAMLGVVLPDTCGPGGDLFALIQLPGDRAPTTLNASGRAGSGITAGGLRDLDLGEIPYRSPWSVTVPGCVDGWLALNERFGRLPLARLLAPAIDTARNGFPVSVELAHSLAGIRDLVASQGSVLELYPSGAPPEPGAPLRRPALADTLLAIATEGRTGFYERDVAQGIIQASRGAITPDDLARPQADWIEPASLEVFGRTGWTIPPNSQGYITLATLWIFEQLDPPRDPADPLYTHLLIEAYRSIAWERADTVSDPDFATWTADELLDHDRLWRRASMIRRDQVTRWPTPERASGGTAFMTVLDNSGMGVSLIQSNYAGIGAGLSAGSTGVWLHNRGADFNLLPGHPNEYAPGKRPLHTLSPTVWTTGPDLSLLLGTRGGDQQPQFLGQFGAHHLHAGMAIDDAQEVARWSMVQPMPGTDSSVRVEGTVGHSVVEGLRAIGHRVDIASEREPQWGPVSAIDVAGSPAGASDPRVSTTAALST